MHFCAFQATAVSSRAPVAGLILLKDLGEVKTSVGHDLKPRPVIVCIEHLVVLVPVNCRLGIAFGGALQQYGSALVLGDVDRFNGELGCNWAKVTGR